MWLLAHRLGTRAQFFVDLYSLYAQITPPSKYNSITGYDYKTNLHIVTVKHYTKSIIIIKKKLLSI